MSGKDKFRDLKREMKANNIYVHQTKYSPFSPPDFVPPRHREVFAQIHTLGRRGFDEEVFDGKQVLHEAPWKLENKRKAAQLVDLATKCRIEQQSEYGWRMRVEAKLFERFDVEVAWYV
jgi:hypothetical protein